MSIDNPSFPLSDGRWYRRGNKLLTVIWGRSHGQMLGLVAQEQFDLMRFHGHRIQVVLVEDGPRENDFANDLTDEQRVVLMVGFASILMDPSAPDVKGDIGH